MSLAEELQYFDSKGILPLWYETIDDYIQRCTERLYFYGRSDFLAQIAQFVMASRVEQDGFRWYHSPESSCMLNFELGLEHFNKLACADFSWVPKFGFQASNDAHCIVLGATGELSCRMEIPGGSKPMAFPVFMVNLSFESAKLFSTGCHEAFHTIRLDCFLRSEPHLAGAEEFDHLGHLICRAGPLVEPAFLPQSWLEDIFGHAWIKLQRVFGQKFYYVMVRLTFDEIVENILNPRSYRDDPRIYLKTAAATSLRHRIICEHLDL